MIIFPPPPFSMISMFQPVMWKIISCDKFIRMAQYTNTKVLQLMRGSSGPTQTSWACQYSLMLVLEPTIHWLLQFVLYGHFKKLALYLTPFRFGVHLKFEGPDFYNVENHKSWGFQQFSFACHFLPNRSFHLNLFLFTQNWT